MGQQLSGKVVLGENVSTTQTAVAWRGGKGMFYVTATFGGGTVKLQTQMPDVNSTVVDVRNQAGNAVSLTAAGCIPFELPPGLILVNISTATAVYAYAVGMHQ